MRRHFHGTIYGVTLSSRAHDKRRVGDSTLCALPQAYYEVMSFEIGGHIAMALGDRALGPKNVVDSELDRSPARIAVRLIRWSTSRR